MADRKPTKPSQFTESFQFIQSLFQEKETTTQRMRRGLAIVSKWLLWFVIAMTILFVLWLFYQFQWTDVSVSEQGLFIPRRP